VKQVTVNGKPTKWRNLPDAVGQPMLEVEADAADNYQITIEWAGKPVDQSRPETTVWQRSNPDNYLRPGISCACI